MRAGHAATGQRNYSFSNRLHPDEFRVNRIWLAIVLVAVSNLNSDIHSLIVGEILLLISGPPLDRNSNVLRGNSRIVFDYRAIWSSLSPDFLSWLS
jgi:hypothetical protein